MGFGQVKLSRDAAETNPALSNIKKERRPLKIGYLRLNGRPYSGQGDLPGRGERKNEASW